MGPEAGLTRVATAAEVAPGAGRVVDVDGKVLAIFNVDGQYFVVDNTCPHRGGRSVKVTSTARWCGAPGTAGHGT